MSVSNYWFSRCITEAEFNSISPKFARAGKHAAFSRESYDALEFWKNNPDNVNWLLPDGRIWDTFSRAFNHEGYHNLGASILQNEDVFDGFLNESTVHKFIVTSRITPVSVLWYALGPEGTKKLPGRMGNGCFHPYEVKSMLEKVKKEFARTGAELKLSRAMKYAGSEVPEGTVAEILNMLPDGLEKALERKQGIMFLARTQL